jgi:hypothetical protein
VSEHDQGWERQYLMTPRPPAFPREQAYKQLQAIQGQAATLAQLLQEVQSTSDRDLIGFFRSSQEVSRAISTHVETLRGLLGLPPLVEGEVV